MSLCRSLLLLLMIAVGCAEQCVAQSRVIELQITADANAQFGTQQEWLEMLQHVGADRVVVKTGTTGSPAIEEATLAGATLINVSGSIKGNRLLLPGGSFTIQNKAGITALIQKLRDDGAVVALAEKSAFGLTSIQLVELHDTLGQAVRFGSQKMAPREALQKISEAIGQDFEIDKAAERELANAPAIGEELRGISLGTSIAIIVRPLGLVFEPQRKQGQDLKLKIVETADSTENWPIGWPLQAAPVQVEPKLFERLALEIRGFPLDDTLQAIEKRTGVPFFYDQNSIARAGIEMSQVKVTLVHEKIPYMVALSKLLNQSKPAMTCELRIDEAGKPFLWISTR